MLDGNKCYGEKLSRVMGVRGEGKCCYFKKIVKEVPLRGSYWSTDLKEVGSETGRYIWWGEVLGRESTTSAKALR